MFEDKLNIFFAIRFSKESLIKPISVHRIVMLLLTSAPQSIFTRPWES
jgi:hypothetical protein